MSKIVAERSWSEVFPIPIAELWELLIDTDRLDQLSGTPRITYVPAIDERNQVRLDATARFAGIPLRWTEMPYEWVQHQWFRVERVFHQDTPFISHLEIHFRFEPLGPSETRFELRLVGVAKSQLGLKLGELLVGQYLMRRFAHTIRTIARGYTVRPDRPYPAATKGKTHEPLLEAAAQRLAALPVDPDLQRRLIELVGESDDRDLLGIRPFVLADAWGVDRIQLLRAFLYAANAGLFDVSWEVLCPNCRVPKVSFSALAALQPEAHCDTCNINYGITFDEYVEVRFNVSPAIREAYLFTYCIGGPGNTRHILSQRRVAAAARQELEITLPEGSYRVRIPRWDSRVTLKVSERHAETKVALRCAGGAITPEWAEVRSGKLTLEITNESAQEILLIVEPDAWGMQCASAALVTSLAEFRQLFSSEVLSPGMAVSVRNLAVLFTDLKSSTQLYAEVGDPRAFGLVRSHFVALERVIARHNGAMVKTIGDAIMAVFLSPADATAAALEMQAALDEINAAQPGQQPLLIKLGLHCGPCIAINANEILDYFGSTVNLAARTQGQSEGGELVVTSAVLDDPASAALLESEELEGQEFSLIPKGFDEPVRFRRIRRRTAPALSGAAASE